MTGGRRTHTGSGVPSRPIQLTRVRPCARANAVRPMRSASVGVASVCSSRSGPLSSRFTTAEPSRRKPPRPARHARRGAISVSSAGSRTSQELMSTTSAERVRCSPTATFEPTRRSARSMRRRTRGGVRTIGGTGTSSEAGSPQRGDDPRRLPIDVDRIGHMLGDAAAADAEMPARRRDTLGARLDHGLQGGRPAVAALSLETNAHQFAGQRARDIGRRAVSQVPDAVAVRAEARDTQQRRRQPPNALSPVCARPRISACTSCVPS